MGSDLRATRVVELALQVGEQLDLFRVHPSHHSFDSFPGADVPSAAASSLRPRKMRDFTVPSGTSVTSAISRYEQPSTSKRTTAVRYGSSSPFSAA